MTEPGRGRGEPITGVARLDGRTYGDLRRALRPRRAAGFGRRLVWALIVIGVLLGAAVYAAQWASENTVWRYSGTEVNVVSRLFDDGDAFNPVFLLAWCGVVSGFLALRIVWMLTMRRAHRQAIERGAIVNGAKVMMDPNGVSVSGSDFGSRWGWMRIEDVHRGRRSLVLVVAQGGLPLPYDALSDGAQNALEQIKEWRAAAREKSLRAD